MAGFHSRSGVPSVVRSAVRATLVAALVQPVASGLALAAEGDTPVAAPSLAPIIVTATKERRNLQHVPITISVVTERDIQARGLNNILDVTRTVPGVDLSSVDAGARNGINVTIRGIANSRFNDSLNDGTGALTTGFYVDDVAMVPVDPNLYDVNRVEILKGPQGTLFGQASMGGTVHIVLNQPDLNDVEASGDVSGSRMTGGGDDYSGDAMVNIPVSPGVLAVRAVGSYSSQGGWIDWFPPPLYSTSVVARGTQTYPGVDNANTGTIEGGRVEILWTPIKNLEITPAFFSQSQKLNQGNAFDRNLNDGLVQNRYLQELRDVSFTIASTTVKYDFGPAALTSITAYSTRNYTGRQDLTYLIGEIVGFNTDGSIPAVVPFNLNYNTNNFSQEIRLQGNWKFSSASALDWLVGGSYLREARNNQIHSDVPTWNINADNDNTFPNGNVVHQDDRGTYKNKAAFANVTLRLGKLSVAAGVRHFEETQDGNGLLDGLLNGDATTASTVAVSESGNSPRYTLSYQVTPNHMAYFNYAEGFRIGGPTGFTNTGAGTPECQPALQAAGLTGLGDEYKSDLVKNFELGLKSQFRDNRTRADIAVYRINWLNLQQSIQLSQYVSSCGAIVTTNIGNARSEGVELELQNVFDNGMNVGGSFSYDNAEIVQAPLGVAIKDGWPLGGVAKVTASAYVGVEQEIGDNLRGSARLDWSYRSSMVGPLYADPTNPLTYNHSYGNLNVRVGVLRDRWSVYLYVDNLCNKLEELGAAPLPGEGFTDRVQIAPPRTVGVRLNWSL